jgi:alkanesulfonate monooxygenase SsuD/methylene tetrahydromethanopterin reductase-like flavin-dependent oxidoreductase (luciferase family)
MLHTYLADSVESARETVRAPLEDYLRSHLAQRDSFLHLPAITDADREALVPLAFEHYTTEASLIGTPESCSAVVERLRALGVDEIACLVDFGLDRGTVLAGLEPLARLVAHHSGTPNAEDAP